MGYPLDLQATRPQSRLMKAYSVPVQPQPQIDLQAELFKAFKAGQESERLRSQRSQPTLLMSRPVLQQPRLLQPVVLQQTSPYYGFGPEEEEDFVQYSQFLTGNTFNIDEDELLDYQRWQSAGITMDGSPYASYTP